jgi:hypothetical protein
MPNSCVTLTVTFDGGESFLRITKAWSHIKPSSIQLNYKPHELPYQRAIEREVPQRFVCVDNASRRWTFFVTGMQTRIPSEKAHKDTTEREFSGSWRLL